MAVASTGPASTVKLAVVPLSSIRQPSELIGYTAVDLLLREAAGGVNFEHEQIVFQPELVVRESTA
ncbi:substrate-binding domain-containing protein [Cryobacterium sp. CG_9.6]|uniref:substrate-binding domain-containing protein n=1 Tax=Cryobacterium sp. CG_9.6 TaxID=2760710 RepID=UPI00247D25DD|nr:DNA-binding LacI/PurR family transcriptional regulator [Cryobacterium sp. CG_9.6]